MLLFFKCFALPSNIYFPEINYLGVLYCQAFDIKSGFYLVVSAAEYIACRSQLFAFSVQVIQGGVSHLEGHRVTGLRLQEGVETLEIAEVLFVETSMVVETSTVVETSMGVETLMAEGNMDIGMAIGVGFQIVELMGIRETIIREPMVAA